MSNKRCSVCLDLMEVLGYSRKEKHTIYRCPQCGTQEILRDADVPLPMCTQTLFDRITQSEETLAVEFAEMMYDRVSGEYRYYSMLTAEFYSDYSEAIAATVAKLKEVCNWGQKVCI